MNTDTLRYKVLSDCIDNWEPLFVLLKNDASDSEYIKMLVDLVNHGFLKCSQNNKNLRFISEADVQAYLDSNDKKDIKAGDIPQSWENMFQFIVTKKGKETVMCLFNRAKEYALEISKKINTYKSTTGKYPESLEKIEGLPKGRPFVSFGKWKYLSCDNYYLIGFQEFDDDSEFYLYDSSTKQWQWYRK